MRRLPLLVLLALSVGSGLIGLISSPHLGGPGQALADDIKVSMPKEATGFRGGLLVEVAKPVKDASFVAKVLKVTGYANGNQTRLTLKQLTEAWKDQYVWCGPAKGALALPEIQVGDQVLVACYQNEMHVRYARVIKPKPEGDKKPTK